MTKFPSPSSSFRLLQQRRRYQLGRIDLFVVFAIDTDIGGVVVLLLVAVGCLAQRLTAERFSTHGLQHGPSTSDEEGVVHGASVAAVPDPFERPKVQLSLEGTVLGLAEEQRQQTNEPVLILDLKGPSIFRPADDVLQASIGSVFEQRIELRWKQADRRELCMMRCRCRRFRLGRCGRNGLLIAVPDRQQMREGISTRVVQTHACTFCDGCGLDRLVGYEIFASVFALTFGFCKL